MSQKFLETSFNRAKLIGDFESGSAEWHDLRSQGVGGSQVGTILGLNPWESAFTAWAKATGRIPETREVNMAMRLGSVMEEPIRQIWEEDNPQYEVFTTGTWKYSVPSREWCHANPDGLLRNRETGEWEILEIKTARIPFTEVPPHYRAQVLWYCKIFGIHKAKLVALFGGNDMQTFDIEYDAFEAESNVMAVARWRACVEEDKRPDWDGSANTYETVRYLNPEIEDREEDLGDLGMHLQLQNDKVAEETKTLNELKSRTLDAMGNAKYGKTDGVLVAVRQQRGLGSPYLVIK